MEIHKHYDQVGVQYIASSSSKDFLNNESSILDVGTKQAKALTQKLSEDDVNINKIIRLSLLIAVQEHYESNAPTVPFSDFPTTLFNLPISQEVRYEGQQIVVSTLFGGNDSSSEAGTGHFSFVEKTQHLLSRDKLSFALTDRIIRAKKELSRYYNKNSIWMNCIDMIKTIVIVEY